MKRSDFALAVFPILLFVLLSFSLIDGNALAQPSPVPSLNSIRVSSDHDYPPYEFNDEQGRPTGFNVELIKAVSEATGLNADVKLGVWNDVREGLENGQSDVIAGMYYSREREKVFDFSIPHNMVTSALFVRNGSEIQTFEQARDKEIIVQKGDIMHDYLLEQGFTKRIVAVNDPVQALELLASGKHDGVLLSSKNQGLYFLNKREIPSVRVVETQLPARKFCFAVRKNNAELLQKLNEGLNILKHTGKYQLLYEKWFGVYEERSIWQTLKVFIMAFIAILLLLIIISIVTAILRVQVKKRTQELRQSEERYRHLVHNAGDIIYITDEKGYIIFINSIAEVIIGYQADEIIGKRFLQFIAPDFLREADEFFQNQCAQKQSNAYHELPLIKKDSSIVWIGQNTQLMENNGQVAGFQAIARDITERKQMEEALRESEERLRGLNENLADGMVYQINSGPDGKQRRFTYVSPAVEWLHGLKVEDSIRNPSLIYDQVDENYQALIREGEARAFASQSKFEIDAPVHLPSGEVRWRRFISSPRVHSDGSVIWDGIELDIHDRKREEEKRQELERRLQRAEKMEALGTLAGGVAHDLNNVLGILVGYSELLLDDIPESSYLRSHVEKIMKSGVRAAAIVQDLLTLARRGVHSESVINLSAVIAEHQKTPEYEDLCSKHPRIRIKANLAADLLNIKGSPSHILKTFMNLMTNAVEAMPEGGLVTVLTANRNLDGPVGGYDDVREGDYVVLSVSDTGEGIPEEDMKHIFEPFYTKKVMGRSGTGLGLAVVWGTIKDHNGYIDVQSKIGQGTTFTLYFPVTREEAAQAIQVVALSDYTGNEESILVVDDIKEQRELAARMLGKLNYRVATAASGEAAVDYLKTHHSDLIVLDMIMQPGMDGLDTYKRILELHPGQRAIIVSGFSSTERVAEAQLLGAGPYIKKPYMLEKLGMAVNEELRRNISSILKTV